MCDNGIKEITSEDDTLGSLAMSAHLKLINLGLLVNLGYYILLIVIMNI